MTCRRLLVAALLGLLAGSRPTATPAAQVVGAPDAASRELALSLERVARSGDRPAFVALFAPTADLEQARAFAEAEVRPGATRVVMQERDRAPLTRGADETRYRVVLDVFTEHGPKGRAATWQLDVDRHGGRWRLLAASRLANVEKLYRLSVNTSRQFEARQFVVKAEDIDLTLVEGSVFTIDTDEGPTGLVLLGRGELRFHPTPETEQGQVKILTGDTSLVTKFDAAYVRFGVAEAHAHLDQLTETPVAADVARRAERVFREESSKSYVLDLGDLSREPWSLVPTSGDFVAEIRTSRYGILTYARNESEPEDISFFDRKRRRNIAMYASAEKLDRRGRFYNEDHLVAYDVLHYEIDLAMSPDRLWLEGETTMRLRVKSNGTNQLTIRLADPLVVHSVVSDRFGRLFSLRARGQNALLVSLPAFVMSGTDLRLTIAYAGRLEPQPADQETLLEPQDDSPSRSQILIDAGMPRGEPHYLYSNRSYWHPQSPVSDYATALMHITVPSPYVCLASGKGVAPNPQLVTALGTQPARLYRFRAERPIRYLSFLVSRFTFWGQTVVEFGERQDSADLTPVPQPPERPVVRQPAIALSPPTESIPVEAAYRALAIHVEANPRQIGRSRDLLRQATNIARFYESILGDVPYASFTLALTEHSTPGGHSPGYFAALNQVLPGTPVVWRNDPAAFEGVPEFFLAHELAHQWWGQAVGWRNYHEQWLSEGFAQYFAALYAHHRHGDDAFADVLRHMRRWSLDASDQGPIYLGYRLGHLKNDGRVFRALVYDKGALVLHMLRRLVGDDVFFRAIRRFYHQSRYKKAGTDDFRLVVESESGLSLERFFEQWVYGARVPRLSYSYSVDAGETGPRLTVVIEQHGELFDVPLALTLDYADGPSALVVVPVREQVVRTQLPLSGTLREVSPTKNEGILAEVTRGPQRD